MILIIVIWKMRVLIVVAGDETMASTRYRVLNAIPFIEDFGISCDILTASKIESPLSLVYQILRKSPEYDVLYIQKYLFPPLHWLPPVFHRLLSSISPPIVYDFDDALYTSQPWHDGTPIERRIQLQSMLRSASVVVTGNPSLSEYARSYAERIVCLPTALPKNEYDEHMKTEIFNQDGITIGWIGNTENLWYLSQMEEPIGSVLSSNNVLKLQIITDTSGADSVPFQGRSGNQVIYREWSRSQELDLLAESDIVIRPLTNDEWTRGKGGYTSVVQAMALGIPVVVTPVSMLSELVTHGESGYHATADSEWQQYLTTLIQNEDKRHQMGQAARRAIDEIGLWTDKYADAVSNIIHFITGRTSDMELAEKYASDITSRD